MKLRTARLPVSAVILGGGQGRRMGGNKLFLSVDGTLLLERVLDRLVPSFQEVVIAVGPEDEEPLRRLLGSVSRRLSLKIAVDARPGWGPLEGLAAALRAMESEWAFVVGCDMPWIQEAVFRAMWTYRREGSDVLCARIDGYLVPLHAFYRRSCLGAVGKALAAGERRLKAFYDDARITVVEEESLCPLPGYRRSFRGLNTPEELRDWVTL